MISSTTVDSNRSPRATHQHIHPGYNLSLDHHKYPLRRRSTIPLPLSTMIRLMQVHRGLGGETTSSLFTRICRISL